MLFENEQLVAWYKRHGFVETTSPGDDTRTMVRKPRHAQDMPKGEIQSGIRDSLDKEPAFEEGGHDY